MRSRKISDNKDIHINIRISQLTKNKIDLLSNKLNKSRSDIIRMILEKSLIYVGVEDENV